MKIVVLRLCAAGVHDDYNNIAATTNITENENEILLGLIVITVLSYRYVRQVLRARVLISEKIEQRIVII